MTPGDPPPPGGPEPDQGRLGAALAGRTDFWTHWGFEPWSRGALTGVARRQRFVKDGFLGRVAEYGAWDYLVWRPGRPEDREQLWAALTPRPEIMTQRFLFIAPGLRAGRRLKSFWLGVRGYAEFFSYWPWAPSSGKNGAPPDLTGLVDLALRFPPSVSPSSFS